MSRQKTPRPIPRAQCLRAGFLGGEAHGKRGHLVRPAPGPLPFGRGEDAVREPGSKTFDGPFDAADIEGVDPQTEDHGVKPGPKQVFVDGISQIIPGAFLNKSALSECPDALPGCQSRARAISMTFEIDRKAAMMDDR